MSRYALTSLGPAERLGAAMIPVRAASAQAYASRGQVNGSPGTRAIAAPGSGLPQDATALAQSHYHRSADSPNLWYPGVYYQPAGPSNPAERAGVSVSSDNQLPMPAVSPLGLPSVSQGRPRLGGQYQLPQKAVSPSYPSLSGSSG